MVNESSVDQHCLEDHIVNLEHEDQGHLVEAHAETVSSWVDDHARYSLNKFGQGEEQANERDGRQKPAPNGGSTLLFALARPVEQDNVSALSGHSARDHQLANEDSCSLANARTSQLRKMVILSDRATLVAFVRTSLCSVGRAVAFPVTLFTATVMLKTLLVKDALRTVVGRTAYRMCR